MAEPLLQNIDGTAAFEPVDGGAVAQVVEGEGPELLILFLGLLGHSLDDATKVGGGLAIGGGGALPAAGTAAGYGPMPEQRLGLQRNRQLCKNGEAEIVAAVDEIDHPQLV